MSENVRNLLGQIKMPDLRTTLSQIRVPRDEEDEDIDEEENIGHQVVQRKPFLATEILTLPTLIQILTQINSFNEFQKEQKAKQRNY